MKSQQKFPRTLSFEFFPPRTDKGVSNLRAARAELEQQRPAFFSVTFGAGGSTRDRTYETVRDIKENSSCEVAPHISCIASTRDDVGELLDAYMALGIKRLVTLRGDIPSGMGTSPPGEFRYASELVAYIRERTGDRFHIEVAAYPEFHPQSHSPADDLRHFKEKVEAGANSALTQYFYSPDAYFRFVDACEGLGLDLPIVPGVMPITNYEQLARFSDACGAEIPRWIRKRLEDMDSLRAFGAEVTADLCRRLLDGGAPGIHFYTLNKAHPTVEIWSGLGEG